jgi:hypothetical protein
MPAVAQPTHAVGRPGNDMRYAGCHLLLAARAPVGLGRVGARDPADEPLAVTVELTAFDPTDGSVQIKPGVLAAAAVGSSHPTSLGGQSCSSRWGHLDLLGVGAEPAPHLAAEIAGGDELLQQRRGGEPGLPELEVELTLDGE